MLRRDKREVDSEVEESASIALMQGWQVLGHMVRHPEVLGDVDLHAFLLDPCVAVQLPGNHVLLLQWLNIALHLVLRVCTWDHEVLA